MWPSVLTTFSYPNPTDRLNNPSHSGVERAQNSVISQMQTFIGTQSSVQGTLLYDVRSPLSDGGGHIQTANKGGTGQTNYNKGDILVASSSSVLTKLAVGSDGATLTVDSAAQTGLSWTNAVANVQSFISTGTWNRPSIATMIYVQLWGGGGGGDTSSLRGGGGGGGGAYINGWFPSSVLGTSQLVSIGAGGIHGGVGGNTVFGTISSLLTAYGGGGGYGNTPGSDQGTGGGGGGSNEVGNDGVMGTGGAGGGILGAAAGANSTFGGAGGASSGGGTGGMSVQGGAGGGAGSTNGSGGGGNGGTSTYGGGGGGGAGSVLGAGGRSLFGGSGGNGGARSSIAGINGSVPGGGGGGSVDGSAGSGGAGKAIIMSF